MSLVDDCRRGLLPMPLRQSDHRLAVRFDPADLLPFQSCVFCFETVIDSVYRHGRYRPLVSEAWR